MSTYNGCLSDTFYFSCTFSTTFLVNNDQGYSNMKDFTPYVLCEIYLTYPNVYSFQTLEFLRTESNGLLYDNDKNLPDNDNSLCLLRCYAEYKCCSDPWISYRCHSR